MLVSFCMFCAVLLLDLFSLYQFMRIFFCIISFQRWKFARLCSHANCKSDKKQIKKTFFLIVLKLGFFKYVLFYICYIIFIIRFRINSSWF